MPPNCLQQVLCRAALSSCLANSTNVYRFLFGKGSSLEILKHLNFDTSKRTIWNQLMTLNLSLSRKCLPCLRNVFPGLVKHCCSPQLCPCGTSKTSKLSFWHQCLQCSLFQYPSKSLHVSRETQVLTARCRGPGHCHQTQTMLIAVKNNGIGNVSLLSPPHAKFYHC